MLSFDRLHQRILLKRTPLVQQDYFSAFNQSIVFWCCLCCCSGFCLSSLILLPHILTFAMIMVLLCEILLFLAPVIQRLDNTFHRITRSIGFGSICWTDSDVSSGKVFPAFEHATVACWVLQTTVVAKVRPSWIVCWSSKVF